MRASPTQHAPAVPVRPGAGRGPGTGGPTGRGAIARAPRGRHDLGAGAAKRPQGSRVLHAIASILETKRHLDGRRERFTCDLIAESPRLAIVRFTHAGPRTAGGFYFPAGSVTIGFFWAGRHYNLYRITGPDGGVIVYRFDVVDAVHLTPGHVSYTDLLLDVWVTPDGRLQVEDEDEVHAAEAAGRLSARRRQIIARTRVWLTRAHPRIIAEAERELAIHLSRAGDESRQAGDA